MESALTIRVIQVCGSQNIYFRFTNRLSILLFGDDDKMTNEGRGRLFRRTDGKYLIYLPLYLAEDSMFPFKGSDSIPVKVSFEHGDNKLIIEKWKET